MNRFSNLSLVPCIWLYTLYDEGLQKVEGLMSPLCIIYMYSIVLYTCTLLAYFITFP